MAARLIVLSGAERGSPLAIKVQPQYLVIEERKGKPSAISLGEKVDQDLRCAEVTLSRGVARVRNIRPWQPITINGERSIDQGETATLRHGDAVALRDVVLRVELPEPSREDSDEIEPTSGASEDQVSSEIVHSEKPAGDVGRLVAGSPPVRLKQQIQCLQLIANAALVAPDPKTLMKHALEMLGEQYPSAAGSILWRRPHDDAFRVSAQLRTDGAPRLSRTVLRHVADTGEAVLSLDTAKDERLQRVSSLKGKRVRSVMCVPILLESRVRGVIQFDDTGIKKFNEGDLALVGAAAGTIAAAVVAFDQRAARMAARARAAQTPSDPADDADDGIGGILKDAAAPTILGAQGGDFVAMAGFVGEAIAHGAFATVVGVQGAPLLLAAGDYGRIAPGNATAAYTAHVLCDGLGRAGASIEKVGERLRGMKRTDLPTPESFVLGRYLPADATLELPTTQRATVAHWVAAEERCELDPPAPIDLAKGDVVLLATTDLMGALRSDEDALCAAIADGAPEGVIAVLQAVLRAATEGSEDHQAGVIVIGRT